MFILMGLGRQSAGIVPFLLKNTKEKILTFDPRPTESALAFCEKSEKVTHQDTPFMWDQPEAFELGEPVVVIDSQEPEKGPIIARRCIGMGYSYVNMGGSATCTKEIALANTAALKADVVLAPDWGVAPGLASMLVAELAASGCYDIRIYCGGLPQTPALPVGYVETFNPNGLVKECTGVVQVVRGGKIENIPALSNRENIYIPGFGVLEAEPTSGSLSLTPYDAEVLEIRELSYKTLRYPGHWDYLKSHVLTQPDPARVLRKTLPKVGPDNKDSLVLHARGMYDYELGHVDMGTYVWDYDEELGISAMAQATGYTVAAVAAAIHDGTLTPGLVLPHSLKNRLPGFFEGAKVIT